MDMVEVNPILDVQNQTALLAVEFIRSALGSRVWSGNSFYQLGIRHLDTVTIYMSEKEARLFFIPNEATIFPWQFIWSHPDR